MSSSLKKEIILGFSLIPDIEQLHGNQLILTTPMGLICGSPVNILENPTETTDFVNHLVGNILDHIKTQHQGDIDGNDGFLLLKDVTIHSTGNQTINLSSLVVFYDQIIGVTFGNPDR